MPDATVLGYVGVVTGVVGAATGIFGACMGVASYRRVRKMKRSDLRLDLQRKIADLTAAVRATQKSIKDGDQSRKAVLSAKGLGGSGVVTAWLDQWTKDTQFIESLAAASPPTDFDASKLDEDALEAKLIEVYRMKVDVDRLEATYKGHAEADARDRDRIMTAAQNQVRR